MERVDPVQPIHIDEAQYLQLTRALHPEVLEEPLRGAVPVDPIPSASGDKLLPPENFPAVPPDQPPGTPIV